jgi:hypothetical protein
MAKGHVSHLRETEEGVLREEGLRRRVGHRRRHHVPTTYESRPCSVYLLFEPVRFSSKNASYVLVTSILVCIYLRVLREEGLRGRVRHRRRHHVPTTYTSRPLQMFVSLEPVRFPSTNTPFHVIRTIFVCIYLRALREEGLRRRVRHRRRHHAPTTNKHDVITHLTPTHHTYESRPFWVYLLFVVYPKPHRFVSYVPVTPIFVCIHLRVLREESLRRCVGHRRRHHVPTTNTQ